MLKYSQHYNISFIQVSHFLDFIFLEVNQEPGGK